MSSQRRKTGQILPRNYGLMLDMPGREVLYVSPLTYMLAQIGLESPKEIRARLHDWVGRKGGRLEDAVQALKTSVEKKDGSLALLNHSRRTETHTDDLILRRMKHYGGVFKAEVKSRSGEGYRTVGLPEPLAKRDVPIGYPRAACECEDHTYGMFKKRRMAQVCVHLALPEVALALDARSRHSRESNITGLAPSERAIPGDTPHLPFTLNLFKDPKTMTLRERAVWEITTDSIMKYFVDGSSQYDLNRELLANPLMFSPALEAAILHPFDRADFKVLRQTEETVARSKLTSGEDRRYAATTVLVDNIAKYLENKRGCLPAGYCREFVGTPWETVARRFEPPARGPVYSVVVSNEHPPLVIARTLADKSKNWVNSHDPVQTDHIARKIGLKYQMVDDATRRESYVQFYLPDTHLRQAGFHIPENLQEEYNTLRKISDKQ